VSSTRAVQLLKAAHIEPTVAVTTLAALLGVASDLERARVSLVAMAVLAGQLSIGWSNDLVDMDRDVLVQRRDKPLATGTVSRRAVQMATGAALVSAAALSALCGWRSAATHLLLLVGSGWAYNLGLKRTAWSWLPYAVAFGSLPSVVTFAANPPRAAPLWMTAAGALLGVGAHFVNVLPDLDDDARTGVNGLPHRLGRRWAQLAATSILTLASVVTLTGRSGLPPVVTGTALLVVAILATVSVRGTGKTPFRAAIGIALVDVVILVVGG
jgi:4-hydroxybenzoate polyprenyltransferase